MQLGGPAPGAKTSSRRVCSFFWKVFGSGVGAVARVGGATREVRVDYRVLGSGYGSALGDFSWDAYAGAAGGGALPSVVRMSRTEVAAASCSGASASPSPASPAPA